MSFTRLLAPTTAFGINLLRQEMAANAGKNVLVSPVSISTALAMTMSGARGQTRSEMLDALSLPNYGGDKATALSYANLLAELVNCEEPGVKLSLANAIWASRDVSFRKEFLDGNRKNFQAQIASADFASPSTLEAINQWVSNKTENRIEKILDEIPPEKVMYLLNAVYFKGDWSVKFDKSLTRDEDFHAAAGVRQHPLMMRTGDMVHQDAETYQAVKLPFGENKRLNLYVFLPHEDITVEKFVENMTDELITDMTVCDWESDGFLWLPRFEVEYDVNLNGSLQALGMNDAFNEVQADFAGMGDAALYVSEVQHKTFARFDEDGGEAAAATSVGVGLESCHFPWEMRVDRPFVMALRDEGSGALLFAGVVNDPK